MARNGTRRASRRKERDEASRAAERTDRVLGLDELARRESVRATGGPPVALVRELGRRSRPMVAELEPITRETMALRGPGERVHSDAHRPRWVDLDHLPRLRPHRFKVPPFERGGRVSGRPEEVGFHTMMQESLTFSWPWRTIGKVLHGSASDFTKPTGWGTGVLVGPNLMLTASHVAEWDGGWMHFFPGFRDGNGDPRFGDSFVQRIRGIRAGSSPTGYDYVICKLAKPLGQSVGWMGTQWWGDEDRYYDGTWFLNGFPGDFANGDRLAVEYPLDIDDIDNDDPGLELETDFFVTGGWSGGPLWGWMPDGPHVIGITSGWEADGWDPVRSVIAGGAHLVELTQFGWDNWQ
jgi:hypothetical protein